MTKQRVNLVPRDLQPQRGFQGEHGIGLLFAALMAYVVISWPLLNKSVEKKRQELSAIEVANDKLKAEYSELSKEAAPKDSKEDQRTVFKKLLSNRSYWGKAFQELSLLSVPNVWLSKLKSQHSETNTVLQIEGLALSSQEMSMFFTVLEKSFFFRNVRLNNAQRVLGVAPPQFSFAFTIELPAGKKGGAGERS